MAPLVQSRQRAQLPQRSFWFPPSIIFPGVSKSAELHNVYFFFVCVCNGETNESVRLLYQLFLFIHACCGCFLFEDNLSASKEHTQTHKTHNTHTHARTHSSRSVIFIQSCTRRMTKKFRKHTNKWNPYILIHQINWKCLPVDCGIFHPSRASLVSVGSLSLC